MCGICGFYGFNDKELLKKMVRILTHRGPDDYGFFMDNKINLGHRRLSIVGISKGHQPIHNENKSVWLVCNGEVYNYVLLKEELEHKGHKFYTETDVEVLVHAYEEWGESCVKKFNGEFAFALWDSDKKKLVLVRDRLGIKPLYYFLYKDCLFFASEIKALLSYELLERAINLRALDNFLTFFCNPLEETMLKGVKKLKPGHVLVFHKGTTRMVKYWDILMRPDYTKPKKYWIDLLFKELKSSVQRRLIGKAPLGVYLSGGIDSSTVLSMIRSLSDEPIRTYSVGFGLKTDELNTAKTVSELFEATHTELILDHTAVKVLPKLVFYLDEPLADPTSMPTYLLSKKAKNTCRVILTGEGADEQFGGYEHYQFLLLYYNYLKRIPPFLRKTAINFFPKKGFNIFFPYMNNLGQEGLNRLSKFVLTENIPESYLSIISIFDKDEKKQLYSKRINSSINWIETFFPKNKQLLNNLLLFENKTLLVDGLLMKLDKTTMACSIEARAPFLDHKLVEIAASIPPSLKIKNFTGKYILRHTMKKVLLKEVWKRKKQRFFVPIHEWFEGEIMDVAKQLLSKENINKLGFLNINYINKMFDNYDKSKLFFSRQLWALLNLVIWYKIYIENEKFKL